MSSNETRDNKAHIIDRRQFGNKIDEIEDKLTKLIPVYCKETGVFLDIIKEEKPQ